LHAIFPSSAARRIIIAVCGPVLATALLSLVASTAFAQQAMSIRSAYVEASDSVYLLNATIDFDLPEGARRAIREGVPLTLDLEIAVQRGRRFWLDDSVATLQQRYELVFHALSERYLVRNLNSGEQSSFATLEAALDVLRVIDDLPILDRALLDPKQRYEFALRASLDVRTMPDTLRFVLFWTDDWRQRSEWYTWSPRL
jgi:hypothetical protein